MRNLKKITALFVAIAMVLSLGITVMAADAVTPTFTITDADGNAVSSAKAGETVTVSMSIPAGSYGASVFWLSAAENVTLDNLKRQAGLNGNIVAGDPAIKTSAGMLTVAEGTPVLSVDVTIGAIEPGEVDIISIYSASMNTEGDVDELTVNDAKATITVKDNSIVPEFTIKNAKGEVVTAAKAGEKVTVSMSIPAGSYGASVFWLSANEKVTVDNLVRQAGLNGNIVAGDPAIKTSAGMLTVAEGTPVLSVDVTIASDATPGELDIISINSASMNTEGDVSEIKVSGAKATLTVLESFAATKAEPTPTAISYEIGTDVAAKLADDIAITVAPTEGDGEAGYKATWAAPAGFDNKVPGEYVFTGTVIGPDDAKAATWTGDLTTTVTVTLTAIADGTLAEVAPVEMQATKEDAEVVVEAFDLAINKGDFADYIAITADMIAVDNETIVTTAAATFEDAVTITIPASTASKNGKFVIAAETVVKGDVVITPAEFKYEEVSYEVSSDGKMEESSELTVTITNNQSEEDFKPEAKAVITVTLTYDGDKTATFVYGDDEGEEITFDADNKVAEIKLPALGEMFKALGLDSFVGASVSVGVTYDDADVLPGEEAAPELDLEVEEDAPTSNKKPSGIGNNKRPSGSGSVVTPSTPDAPVDPENPETPVDPENPDAPVVTGTFADVPATHWAYEAIEKLAAAGIINGVGDGTFNVDGNVTRAEFAKMIVVAMGIEATATESAFEDCTADAWFTPYVVAAAEAGYVTGMTETYFGADELISRQDICTILGRVLAVESEVAAEFIDADQIADYAVKYVNALVEMGIINGYEDGSFRPEANATRAEAAKIVNGVLDITAEEEAPVEEAATEEAVEEVTEEAAEEVVEAE